VDSRAPNRDATPGRTVLRPRGRAVVLSPPGRAG